MTSPGAKQAERLAYSDPRGSGRPVIFVHGFGHNRSVWQKVAGELPDGLRPISVDLRGHGESPWSPGGAYDLVDYASDLPLLLDALDLERAVVVGHSLGGNVSTLFAAAESSRVEALVLVDTGPALEIGGLSHVVEEVGNATRTYRSIADFEAQLRGIHPSGDLEVVSELARTGLVQRVDGLFEVGIDPGVLAKSDSRTRALVGDPFPALPGPRRPRRRVGDLERKGGRRNGRRSAP